VDLNLLDSLIAIDGDQKIYPHLATKWTIDEGSRRFTFTLRDDVKFHDGTPLDSTAVKRT
jgi:ABC-type transport system substrate-binding protein